MFPRPRFTHLALALLCLSLLTRPARAAEDFEHSFSQAQRLYDNLEYEAALDQLTQARRLPHEEEREVQVSLYEGAILANLGRWEGARRAFRAALLKDPDAKLMLLAPKVNKELEAARSRVRKELALSKSKEPKSRPPAAIPPREPSAATPPSSVATAPPADRPEQPPPAVALVPPGPAAPPAQALVPTVEARAHRGSPVPLVLLGAGVVAGGVGGYFGWSSRRQVASARMAAVQTEAAAQLAQAQGNARVANLLLGTAGVAVVGAALSWLLLREPEQGASAAGGAR